MPVPFESNTSLRRMSTLSVPKQDVNFDTYDFQLYNPQNDMTFESKDLEASFCRDFVCCGLVLSDLHDLLQHYEECHVRMEDDECSLDGDSWSSISSPVDDMTSIDSEDFSKFDDLDTLKKKAFSYISDMSKSDFEDKKFSGKKRSHSQMSDGLPSAIDLLTQSAIKKIALSNFGNGVDITDKDFLAQAGAILASANSNINADKPYKCPVSSCDKAYKNPNGLKYHNQHGHCNLLDGDLENNATKPYQCTIGECGKRYKNLNGLKYHIEHSHMVALNQTLASFGSLFPTSSPSSTTSPMLGAPITFNIENPSIFPLL